jgi:gliding motility-associated lipoprotein GldD
MMKNNFLLLLVSLIFVSCGEDKLAPKPPTYLRLDLPKHEYRSFTEENCHYSFKIAKLYEIKQVTSEGVLTCHKDIHLGPLNGVMHFSYIKMDKPLSDYINFAINKVDEHKIKATAIEDTSFINSNDRVYGTLFELQGDVASPFQFYLTDSLSRFISGVVYFNMTPNYDSLKPTLDYLKIDLYKMINTFKW